ncbi:MAG: bifunctional diaminohydroxyphosphoribosylaminopyrimidine deaminase/5-amino-6-(5-phosphoribosylamino)uracil reductase RibD [Bacteroidetes bacterium]|nr:bifunctional diaminohydroxyphosphoribosylaminopyrimidine deaminase/5-amino-6-(5-phosphoribosylamino)uracil reductase RibD [Bacteroidota bacterium]
MSEISTKAFFIQRCIQLAKKGINHVSPNPMVGSVITIADASAKHGQRIVGEGYHKMFGGPHAEVNAINSVAENVDWSKCTIYVSLEPCNHFGKTPPCSHLIVEKGIKKAVVGALDPNPLVAGKGIEYLISNGVKVEFGILEKDCFELNSVFNTFYLKKRPFILLKWAQTTQKHIADTDFNSKWISNPKSRQLVHKWRSQVAAIMVGTNTAIYDNPSLTTRLWAGTSPTRILVDRKLKVNQSHNLFNTEAPTIILNETLEKEVGNLKWVAMKDFSAKGIVNKLYELNIQSVLIEGGSQLLQSFLDQNLWDEARVFTGTKEFDKGITAPKVDAPVLAELKIDCDKLEIYLNNQKPNNE